MACALPAIFFSHSSSYLLKGGALDLPVGLMLFGDGDV